MHLMQKHCKTIKNKMYVELSQKSCCGHPCGKQEVPPECHRTKHKFLQCCSNISTTRCQECQRSASEGSNRKPVFVNWFDEARFKKPCVFVSMVSSPVFHTSQCFEVRKMIVFTTILQREWHGTGSCW